MPSTNLKVQLRLVARWRCPECGSLNIEDELHFQGGAIVTDNETLICMSCETEHSGGMVSQRLDDEG